jgi:PPIC-type PPIASE domain
MRKSWLLCVLLGTFAWGQAAPGTPPPPQPAPSGQPAQAPTSAKPAPPPDMSASVPPTAAVITVNGVCAAAPKPAAAKGTDAKPAAKTPAAECKTVYTKADFEKLANGVAPNMTPQLKKQLASVLPRLIAMSTEAKKKGLDKTPQFEETLKFAKMQILTQELQRKIQDDAAKVPPADIEAYYKKNPEAYEQYNLDRLFVPRTKQPDAEAKDEEAKDEKGKDEKLTEEQQKAKEAAEKAKNEENEQAMTKLAESLRTRAAAGEDFMKLQKEAFEAAGMKIESPTVNLPKVRRTGLPPAHAAVFDLKAGDVSQIISDTGGHYVYKVNSNDQLPLDQVKDEIHNKLQQERTKEAMDKVNNSFKVETNEAYFGPPTPGGMPGGGPPPPRMPHPHVPPAPTTPAPATPPPAQAPAPKPN